MRSSNTGEPGVARLDRLGHWQTRHPWLTGTALGAVFLLMILLVVALRDGVPVVSVAVAVPGSAVFGLVMAGMQRNSVIVRHGLDVHQYSALRRAYRSARHGEPVDLDPPLHELALHEAQRQLRALRPARWVLFGIGTLQLLIGATLLWLELQFGLGSDGWWSGPLGVLTGLLMFGLAVYSPRSARRIVTNLDGSGQDRGDSGPMPRIE